MTTDTTALQERIAEELYYDQHPEGRHRSEWPTAVYPDDIYEYRDLAAAVLPVIAAEVQAAKAEALREMQEHHEREADKAQTIAARGIHLTIADGARNRATEYETGDSDDHR